MSEDNVTVEYVEWTPEEAGEALSHNEVNRRIRKMKVDQYTRDMAEDRWNFCDQAVTFNEQGHLINGQHRLTAQVKSGTKRQWIVVRKAPLEAQPTMDTGIARTAGDHFHFAGESNGALMAAVARLVTHVINGTLAKGRFTISTQEIADTVDAHPTIKRSTEMAMRSKGGMTPIAPSVLGTAHWMIRQANTAAEADAFLHRITTLSGEEEGSPVLALARRSNEMKRAQQRVHARDLLALVIKAWNYDVEDKTVSKLSVFTRGDYKTPVPLTRNTNGLGDQDREDD